MILILSGLPGSGKTTQALEWVAEDPSRRRRVNYDDIRVQLYGSKGQTYFNHKDVKGREKAVRFEAISQAENWLKSNPAEHSIVVDNTNLTVASRAPWENLAREIGVPLEQSDIDPGVSVCVQRDRLRTGDDRVGRAVIERMALFTGWIDWNDPNYAKKFVVVDIDGTLSDPSHRLLHINPVEPVHADDCLTKRQARNTTCINWKCPTGKPSYECYCEDCKVPMARKPRWDLFHAEVDKDPPKPSIVELVKFLDVFYSIIIVSGRSPEHGCGIKTEDWLNEHLGVNNYEHVFMRQAGDYKPDYLHKAEILDLLPKDRIAFTIDDRDQVVNMWRKAGLTCLQVEKGEF